MLHSLTVGTLGCRVSRSLHCVSDELRVYSFARNKWQRYSQGSWSLKTGSTARQTGSTACSKEEKKVLRVRSTLLAGDWSRMVMGHTARRSVMARRSVTARWSGQPRGLDNGLQEEVSVSPAGVSPARVTWRSGLYAGITGAGMGMFYLYKKAKSHDDKKG